MFQADIKVFANASKALNHKRAFGRYTGALTAIDLTTRFKIGKLIRSHASLEVELEALRVEVHGLGHTLRVLRLDSEFVTAAIEKCIYELPHAPTAFRKHSDAILRSFGFSPTVSEPRLYVRMLADGTKASVTVHVDGFGIAASTPALKR